MTHYIQVPSSIWLSRRSQRGPKHNQTIKQALVPLQARQDMGILGMSLLPPPDDDGGRSLAFGDDVFFWTFRPNHYVGDNESAEHHRHVGKYFSKERVEDGTPGGRDYCTVFSGIGVVGQVLPACVRRIPARRVRKGAKKRRLSADAWVSLRLDTYTPAGGRGRLGWRSERAC